MIDENTYDLQEYERKIDKLEKLDASFRLEIDDNLNVIEEQLRQIYAVVRMYEHENGLDFSEYVKDTLDVLIGDSK